MQVNVFIIRGDRQSPNKLLVLSASPQASIPTQHQAGWVYFATTTTDDQLFGSMSAEAIEAQIAAEGFAIVLPETPDRR